MDNSPSISVVVFSYNFEEFLSECIESVLAQTKQPFEIIICDDCSTDDSWGIISSYRQQYPQLICAHRQEENVGPARNGTFALKQARGDLVSWIDGDDRWLPRKLELEWESLRQHPDARIAYSNVHITDAAGQRTSVWYDGESTAPPSGDVFVPVFARRFFPKVRSVFRDPLVYRVALEEVGYLDEGIESYWDWDEKLRLTARFSVAYSGYALVEYRRHRGGFSSHDPERHLRALTRVYEKHISLLDKRTKAEAMWVRCNMECLLAESQAVLSPTRRSSFYSSHNVYKRNRALWEELEDQERVSLKDLSVVFAQLLRQMAREDLQDRSRGQAFKHWLESARLDSRSLALGLLAKILLPQWLYPLLDAMYRRLFGA